MKPRYTAPDINVQLSEELSGSLRELKVFIYLFLVLNVYQDMLLHYILHCCYSTLYGANYTHFEHGVNGYFVCDCLKCKFLGLNLGFKAEKQLQNENHTEDWALDCHPCDSGHFIQRP